jgi:hypothetical protein
MLNLTLYQILIDQLPDKPNLSVVQERHPLPENWPVMLKSIDSFRKQVQGFVVTDGENELYCTSNLPEAYNKVNAMELGTIFHLMGPQPYFSDPRKQYCVDIHDVYTLKEFDDYMKHQQQLEMERLARLREQDYLEQLAHEQSVHRAGQRDE